MRRALQTLYGIYAAAILLGLVLVLLAPVMMVLPTLRLRRRAGRIGMRVGMALAGLPFRVRGIRHLPAVPCIVVSNHASYLDGLLMTAALPEHFTFVVQHGAARWPWFGLVIRRMGVTFVNRSDSRQGARQTRGLIRRLAEGESLAVFPEGGFARPPGLRPFRKGAFMIAAHANAPVVPAVIRGTRAILGEGQRLPRWGRVEIELFAPLAPQGDHRHAVAELRDRARAVVLRHCGEPDAAAGADNPASQSQGAAVRA